MLLMKVSFISHIINIKMQFGIMKENVYARLTVKVIHIIMLTKTTFYVITFYLFISIKKDMQVVDVGVRRCRLA